MNNGAEKLLKGGMKKTKGFFNEFKTFISQGNILDMAVGVVIGTAFRAIVSSLVSDIVMPAVGKIIGGTDVSDLKHVLTPEVLDTDGVTVLTPEVAIRYGAFIQYIIDFLLIALCMFVAIKVIMGFRKKYEELSAKKAAEEQAAAPPEPTNEEKMLSALTEIRDLLKEDKKG